MYVSDNCPDYKITAGTLKAGEICDCGAYANKLATNNLEISKEILETAQITEARVGELSCNATKIRVLNTHINANTITADFIAPSNITFDLEAYDVNIEIKNNRLIITYKKK